MKTFEEYLMENCPCHTNNGPEGFERWLEELDHEQYMFYADSHGHIQYLQVQADYIKEKLNELTK